MAVSFVAASSGNSGSATSSSYATTLPTGWAADDLVIIACHIGGTSLTASIGAGWTAVPGVTFPVDEGTASRIAGAWYRVMQGGDTAPTITVSGGSTGGWTALAFRGVDTTTPIAEASSATASSTSIGLPSLTVADGTALAAFAHGRVPSGTSALTGWTVDSDYTEDVDHGTSRNSGTSQNVQMVGAHRLVATGATISGDTFTTSGTASLAVLLVEVSPAAAAEPPPEDGPAVALSPRVEIVVDGFWTDITSDVRQDPGITIVRGRQDEQSTIGPSRALVVINNRDGKYSPRNPTSVYYGEIGRNTTLRVSTEQVIDTFGRTETGPWGTAETGQTWTRVDGADADYPVTSGAGIISVDTVAAVRQIYVPVNRRDMTVGCTIKPGVVATGASIQMALMARRVDADNMYQANIIFGTTGEWDVTISKRVGGSVSNVATTTSFGTYDATTELRVEFTVVGSWLLVKATDLADQSNTVRLIGNDTSLTSAGSAGCRAFLTASNTNTLPVTLSYDDFEVLDVRFTGEVVAWPSRWDVTGSDVWVPLEAAGILRRLGRGNLQSALARAILSRQWEDEFNTGDLLAYWPLEDQSGSTQAASGLPGRQAMTMKQSIEFAAAEGPGGSDSLPSINTTNARLFGNAPSHIIDGDGAGWWLMFVWRGEGTSMVPLQVDAAGTLSTWRVTVTTSAVTLTGLDGDGATQASASVSCTPLDGEWHLIVVDVSRSGTAIAGSVVVDGVSDTDTAASQTLGPARRISTPGIGAVTGITSAQIGHIAFWSFTSGQGGLIIGADGVLTDTMNGYTGEAAIDRIERLCDEHNLPPVITGTTSGPSGPQRVATLADLFTDAADADQGILYETRQTAGIGFRTHTSLLDQTPVELDYAAKHLVPPLEPTDDDLATANVVTVTKLGGSSATVEIDEGRMSTQIPPTGAGRAESSTTLNLAYDGQIRQTAGWLAHLGTWDEARYPSLAVELRRPEFTASQELTTSVQEIDVGDRTQVANPPAWLPPDPVDVLVQGYTERITPFRHRIEFNCSPAGPWTAGEYGSASDPNDEASSPDHYDTAGSELAAGVDSDDTSLSVETTDGQIWTTDTDDLPFDIGVGGERMTVTAITGASSPQTFTVTRSVNGVVKAHSAGADVRLWAPAYWGL